MKLLGLRSIVVRKYNHFGNNNVDNNKEYPNILEQDFFAKKPSTKWVGDIAYIYTLETRWTYLAIVMDLFDLKVVGWTYSTHMTDELVIEAFKKAMVNRGLSEEGIFHSDRGSQYTSDDFETMLSNLKIKHSHATLLLNKKIIIHEISKRLGHSDISITLNTYTHTSEIQEKRVIKTLSLIRLFQKF